MAGKREKPEDIVLKLRQVEVLQGQGKSVSEDLMSRHEHLLLDGPDGKLEVFVDPPSAADGDRRVAAGIAMVAHPHPLFGGTADNKVVTTLAKSFRELGCVTLRPSFRGVGASEGRHDRGIAETEDLLAIHDYARNRFGPLPLYLAGFSFGAYVVTRLAKRLQASGAAARRLVLVGTAAGFIEGDRQYETEAVAPDTIVIHGADYVSAARAASGPIGRSLMPLRSCL